MEKSTTKSKIVTNVEKEINQVVKKIKKWTRKELQCLIDDKKKQDSKPLIVPINDRLILVGNYAIQHISNQWHMIYRYNDKELVFGNKKAAILYAICCQTSKFALSDQILQCDQDINRLDIEIQRLQQRFDISTKKGNAIHMDLYSSKQSQANARLMNKKNQLEKILDMAKYFNR